MKTLAILSQKGGSGKTTLTINLAVAAALDGQRALVVDLDPQHSTASWSKLRQHENPIFVEGSGPTLEGMVKRAEGAGADFLVIDTAPKDENVSLQAAKLADIVLIPCQPSSLDLHAVSETVNTAKLAGKPAYFVLNACKANSILTRQAKDALGSYSVPIAPVLIGSRVDFVKSLLEGEGVLEYAPSSKAANEIRRLMKFLEKQTRLAA